MAQAVEVFPNFSPSCNRSCSSNDQYVKISKKINDDFIAKLKLTGGGFGEQVGEFRKEEEDGVESSIFDEKLGELNEENKDDDEEFSFACTNPGGSPISADDVFQNGQIRPVFPLFNRDILFSDAKEADSKPKVEVSSLRPPLKKLFIEEPNTLSSSSEIDEFAGDLPGTYCEWSGNAVEASPKFCKKSNSTGFSKLRRFRDLVRRSHSDGRDAFVFLNNPSTAATITKPDKEKAEKIVEKTENKKRSAVGKSKVKGNGVRAEKVSSAHEKLYVRNRAKKEVDKRKSYLPYRQGLVGFFTSVNGLSRNVHPF